MKHAILFILILLFAQSVHSQSIELLKLELQYNYDWTGLNYSSDVNHFCIYKSNPDKNNLPTICGFVFKRKKFSIDNYIQYQKSEFEEFNYQLISQEKFRNGTLEGWILIWETDVPIEVGNRSKTLEYVIHYNKMIYSITYTNYIEYYQTSLKSAKSVLNSIKINSP